MRAAGIVARTQVVVPEVQFSDADYHVMIAPAEELGLFDI